MADDTTHKKSDLSTDGRPETVIAIAHKLFLTDCCYGSAEGCDGREGSTS